MDLSLANFEHDRCDDLAPFEDTVQTRGTCSGTHLAQDWACTLQVVPTETLAYDAEEAVAAVDLSSCDHDLDDAFEQECSD